MSQGYLPRISPDDIPTTSQVSEPQDNNQYLEEIPTDIKGSD
jgi:hypothetical protein